jgi:UDP-2-acetamido-3-amino-2,3-dideoxy-glucuronate N-acetyltransferase
VSGDTLPLPRVGDLAVVSHAGYVDARGVLCPIELARVLDFPILRLFWVTRVPTGQERGGHAHRRCSQYLICMTGSIEVTATDGEETVGLMLEPGQAVLLKPGIWAAERYLSEDALLLVLCDQPYDPDDYITDIDTFLSYRQDHAV